MCPSAEHFTHILPAQLPSPKVKACCDHGCSHRHHQHQPSGSWPDCEVQLRPADIPWAMLYSGPYVTSKQQCQDVGQEYSAWRTAKINRNTLTNERSWSWARQWLERADECREQSPQHREGPAVPPGGKGPLLWSKPSGFPSLRRERLQAQVVGTDSELLFKSWKAGHTGEWRSDGVYHKNRVSGGTDRLGWS